MAEPDNERYELTWPGKQAARRLAADPPTGSLRAAPAEGVAESTTRNLLIVGENLEVLRLLQESHAGRVKLIYIDPPYNTGNDFLYNDDFKHREAAARPDLAARLHADWLTFMYPRLTLARTLLRDDGAIFVSIDDNEVHNLRHLMDEIFGTENFIATVIWQKVFSPKNSARHFSEDHDYIVVYARDGRSWAPSLLPRTAAMEARYANRDGDPRGPWASSDLSARNHYSEGTYPVTCPSGRVIEGPPTGTYWRISREKLADLDRDNRIYWGKNGDNMPRLKRFLREVKGGRVPQTLWTWSEVGHTQEAKKELLERVSFRSSDSVFDTPKPTRLMERILRIGTRGDTSDIVLDFFAGTGTTGEAVMKLNQEDGGDRRFILVQSPERTGHGDYPAISDITKQRLRSAAAALDSRAGLDCGFRVLHEENGGVQRRPVD